ncbi:unnamed protein product [Rotaria sp. Silwood1]|nr:unnamed protein product [Rotaria sp. Silwood1]CAF3886081.1 unnamed protein product [Rotaria sp. Silwood1]CAF3936778.1 unnamed protein product [Rotaria sp. Silwood1]CAF4911132.1 unnamed protein product [Rotaria sp. Silwood1]CAF4984222.1 unnamed protein product [Rotaria sp. Silwood1]
MNPTIIYRVRSPEPTSTCIYFRQYEIPAPYQSPCEIYIATNKQNNTQISETQSIHRDLKQIKDDIRQIKQQQQQQQQQQLTSPTFYTINQEYPSEATFINTPPTSRHRPPASSTNSIFYCTDCDSIIEKRPHVERSIHRPKTGTTTYQDSYKRRTPSPKPIGYVCYPVYTDRSQSLKELQKRMLSSSTTVHHCVPPTLASFENKYPTRR